MHIQARQYDSCTLSRMPFRASDNWCLCCSLFTSHICPCQSPCVFRSVKVERYEIRFPVGINSVWFLAGPERHHRHWPSQVHLHFKFFFFFLHQTSQHSNLDLLDVKTAWHVPMCRKWDLLSAWDMHVFLQIKVPVSQLASPGFAELSYTFRYL